jgi:hypothetical protein
VDIGDVWTFYFFGRGVMYPNKVEDVASKKNKNLLNLLLLDVSFMNEVAIASLDDVIFW